ncbi:MAG: D-alanyl-D-alanine dipeptidase [Chlamydiota bacterium]
MYRTDLVELKKISPGVILDIRYATPHNFAARTVYSSARCYLQRRTAERLDRVQRSLEIRGFGLKVFDGYRPLSVQKIFWSVLPDPQYVADPLVGSKHNRGAAVDLTLVDRRGEELLMPTSFDDFTESAHHDYQGAQVEAIQNRNFLKSAMESEGFLSFPSEWWHYDDPDWERYPILNVSFESLGAKEK